MVPFAGVLTTALPGASGFLAAWARSNRRGQVHGHFCDCSSQQSLYILGR